MGEANDGRPGVVVAPSVRTGIRDGGVGALIGTEVLGDIFRLLAGESSILW